MDTTAATIELRATANASHFTRTHAVADTTESPSLSLRPLKKHTNIRLGKKVDLTGYPSKSSLFTISNKHGWFFAGNEHGITASPLSELRIALGQSNSDEEVTFMCQVKLDLGSIVPLFICLAAGENMLAAASSSVVMTWDVQAILRGETTPSNSMTLNELVIVDVHPNPGDNPELVAILTTGQSQDTPCVVVLLNCVTNTEMVRWSGMMREGTAPVAVSWSTRGKQIAIGTSGGDILQYSPMDPAVAKATIPQAQGPDLAGTMPIMIQWLSNYTFYVIYAQPRQGASLDDYQPDQHNYILTYDKKSNHVTDISIPLPWDPYGLSREPGHQIKSLRGWGRFKHLIFVNDAHASDVGLIGCIGDASSSEESGVWSKISFEDGSITFPLTSEMDETSLIGMDMDLSAEAGLLGANQANGDDPTIPAAPIIYLYTNDLVVVAFHVVSEDGLPYPGLARVATSNADRGMEISMEKAPAPVEPVRLAPSAFGSSAPAAPSFGQTGFGFGAAATPTFGSSGFGAAPAKSASSGFASHATTGPSLGFGAFANAKPAFGQSSFGAPPGNTGTAASPPAQNTATSGFGGGGFAAFAGPKPAFGQPSFGVPPLQFDAAAKPSTRLFGGSTSATSAFGSAASTNSAFGSAATTTSPFGSSVQVTTAFGQPAATPKSPVSPNVESTSGPSPVPQAAAQSGPAGNAPAETTFKPASGFGAFSKLNTGGTTVFNFSNPKPIDPQAKPLAFAGFAGATMSSTNTTAAPAFGAPTSLDQPKFGQSTFGQSTFGQSGFGQSTASPAKSPFATATATSSTTASSGGGFSAFASAPTGFAALAKTANESKPAAHLGLPPGTPEPPKPKTPAKTPSKTGSEPKSFFGSNAAVSQPGFAAKGLRDNVLKVDDDDDEEVANKAEEKFPEEAADKLEPETTYEGPGLFGPVTGKGKATKGLGGLGLKDDEPSDSNPKAGTSKPVVAFGQKIDSSKVAASTAAAFKPTTPVSKPVSDKEGQNSFSVNPQGNDKPAPPVSAFGSAASGASKTPQLDAGGGPKGDGQNDDEESVEGSIEVDDDINEFLEGDDFDSEDVDGEEDEEDGGEDNEEGEGNEDEEDDDDEDDDDEDDDEGLSDLPDSDQEAEEEPTQTKAIPTRGIHPSSIANKPATAAPFNPFGRPATSGSTPTKEPKDTPSPAKQSVPSLLDRTSKAPAAQEASTSAGPVAPSPRPQPIIQPVGTPISSFQPKAKPKPASPKAAFGSWTPPPAPKGVESSKPARPQTPPGLFGKGSTAQSAPSTSKLNPAIPSPLPSTDREKPATPTPEVKAIQPVHPELQAQLDRVLNEYSAILFHINERSKKVRAHFEAFKGTGPPVGNEYQASFEWSGQNLPILKKTLEKMDETAATISDRMSKERRLLDELCSSTLRLEIKKEEASRYLRARQNPEFLEKFIKPRGLGPEHAESQIKLRKGLKAQKDRLTDVEEQVTRLKKKVDKFKAGTLSLQPPNLAKIQNTFQNVDWYLSELTDKLDNLTAQVDELPSHSTSKEPRRLSTAGAHNAISRTSSFGPEIIATTAETFSAEVKMTKLSELMVEARTAAPINRPKTNSTTPQTAPASSRKNPFTAKTIVLREVMTSRTAQPCPTSAAQLQHNRGPGAAYSPVNSTMDPPVPAPPFLPPHPVATPAKASGPPVELARRAPPGANRQHTRAPQISRDGPVHTSSFSFGPPPPAASNAVKLPTNFVPIASSRPS